MNKALLIVGMGVAAVALFSKKSSVERVHVTASSAPEQVAIQQLYGAAAPGVTNLLKETQFNNVPAGKALDALNSYTASMSLYNQWLGNPGGTYPRTINGIVYPNPNALAAAATNSFNSARLLLDPFRGSYSVQELQQMGVL